MKCPDCGSDDAYSGFFGVDCPEESCKNFKGSKLSQDAKKPDPTGTFDLFSGALPSGTIVAQKLNVVIVSAVPKKTSVSISFKADGDPGSPDKVVEFWWSLPPGAGFSSTNGQTMGLCTLSNPLVNRVEGIDADGTSIYITHWMCVTDGIQPNGHWTLEAKIY